MELLNNYTFTDTYESFIGCVVHLPENIKWNCNEDCDIIGIYTDDDTLNMREIGQNIESQIIKAKLLTLTHHILNIMRNQ